MYLMALDGKCNITTESNMYCVSYVQVRTYVSFFLNSIYGVILTQVQILSLYMT